MTDFIHAREYLHGGDVVIVECSHQCNVRVMDDQNFNSYRRAGNHTYYGGFYQMLPARIAVPHDGYWNVTIECASTDTISSASTKASTRDCSTKSVT